MTARTIAVPEREHIARRYHTVRAHTEALAAPLHPEDQVVQSMPDVSPTKWHRAHTTWFFETFLLCPSLAGYLEFHPGYRYLFNSYYEAVGAQYPRPRRGLVSRPTVEEVARFRTGIDDAMDELVVKCNEETWPRVAWLTELGVQHEQQHQELLLMDIKHVLSCNPLDPVYAPDGPDVTAASGAPVGWVELDGGLVEVGRGGDGAGFTFDNESPRHFVHLCPYRIADRLVTAGEWMEFIADDGYRRPELWLSDGWYAVQANGWGAPLYWQRDGDDWTVFTLRGRRPIDRGEPVVHVSHYEADAYARWRGARLPTEFEWEHAAAHLHQREGQVWQWTASAYLPYPGFRAAPGAVGEYNGKFMSGQMVMRGGACVTPDGHARPSYRNFFPPGCRWMYAGLRLAADAS